MGERQGEEERDTGGGREKERETGRKCAERRGGREKRDDKKE